MTPLLNWARKRRQVDDIQGKKQRVSFLFSRRRLLALVAALLLLEVIFIAAVHRHLWGFSVVQDHRFERSLPRVQDLEATDTGDQRLNYGIVVDCGSGGSRVFVYFWSQHNGNPHDLLDIKQMRDHGGKPVVRKIQPGISTMAATPDKASDYMQPLLSFAAEHIPASKHKDTPLYILCTAGMRLLPKHQQTAILQDLVQDVPLEFNFIFSEFHAEVISGKQEGVYAWISINFALGRFDHMEDDDAVDAMTSGTQKDGLMRKRTVGVLDMGGGSLQIAYEVPKSKTTSSPEQEAAANVQLAEFHVGCDLQKTYHLYGVYVKTFKGLGANFARQVYEETMYNSMVTKNRLLKQHIGERPETPLFDPCLPFGATSNIGQGKSQMLHLQGNGDWNSCRKRLKSLLKRNDSPAYWNSIHSLPVSFTSEEFYGISEFYATTEDILHMGGPYNSLTFGKAAQEFCMYRWSNLQDWFRKGLFSSHTDQHRLKYQCFKLAWVHVVLHHGLHVPHDYAHLTTAGSVHNHDIQWTLGVILVKTGILPRSDSHQASLHPTHARRHRFSIVYIHHFTYDCAFIGVLCVLLFMLWPRQNQHGGKL